MEPLNNGALPRATALRRALRLLLALLAAVAGVAQGQNADPTITAIGDRSININWTTGPISFQVDDTESGPTNLTVVASSGNTNLVPQDQILLGGNGASRNVTVNPATNQTGTAQITLTVTDPNGGTTSTSFQLTVLGNITFASSPASITDKERSFPFSSLSLVGPDPVTVTISFPDARGSFETNTTFTKALTGSDATYTLSSRPLANAQGFLRALDFAPAQNRIPLGQTESTLFTVRATDANGPGVRSITLTVSPSNDPPALTLTGSLSQITDKNTTQPFSSITVQDPDSGDSVTVTIAFPDGRGSFPASSGFTSSLVGTNRVYTLSSGTPAAAQSFLQTLTFTPVENRIPVFEIENTVFAVTVTDSLTASTNRNATLPVFSENDPPSILGSVKTLIPDNRPSNILAGITLNDPDMARFGGIITNQRLTLTISNSPFFFGSFTGFQNGSRITNNPAGLSSTLSTLPFNPEPNLLPVGETNVISLSLRLVDLTNEFPVTPPLVLTTNVHIVSANDPPSVAVTLIPASTPDNQSVQPFRVTITDPDINDTNFVLRISPINTAFGTLTPSGAFTGNSLAVQNAALGLVFSPTRNLVTNAQPIPFRISVTNAGSVAIVTNNLTVQEVNDLPDIYVPPTTPAPIREDQTASPFSGVSILDADRGSNQPVTVFISLDDPAKGTLSPAGPFGTTSNINPATATTLLRNVVFTPARNRIPVGQTETATFVIQVTDALGGQRTSTRAAIGVIGVDGAPIISGIPVLQPVSILPLDGLPVWPFSGLSITDNSTNLTVTVSLDNAAKGYLTNLGGFVQTGPGQYQLVTNTAAISPILTNLQFIVSTNFAFPPDSPGGTTFTIRATDSVPNTATATLAIVLKASPRNLLVTHPEDDAQPGSLRHAVALAGHGDHITFALSNYPAFLRLTNVIDLNRNITINGPGADLLTLTGDSDGDTQPDTRLFNIYAQSTIQGLTLTKGLGRENDQGWITGGALYIGPGAHLDLRFSAVTESRAAEWGGAIDVDRGSLNLANCLILSNSTDVALGLGGGAISIYTDFPCSILNSTFSGNTQRSPSGYGGGAIYVENYTPSDELGVDVTHCTFAENVDAAHAGSSVSANVFGTLVFLRNSIFADNQGRNLEIQGAAGMLSDGGNLSDDSTRTVYIQGGQPQEIVLLDSASDRTSTNAALLAFNSQLRPIGGYVLSTNSPAIARAVGAAAGTDQLGRIRDHSPDSGALELRDPQHLLINEIHFDPATNEVPFVELYVSRDSFAIDLGGYKLAVDGTNRCVVPANTLIQPGRGLVIADGALSAGDAATPTGVLSNIIGGTLRLGEATTLELRRPDDVAVARVTYVGQFVDPEEPNNDTKFAGNSITLAPQFRGFAFLPHRTVLPVPPLFAGASLARNGAPNSPGRDTGNTAFGSPNAAPIASTDDIVATEDQPITIPVLDNDLDADGQDQLVVVNVSTNGNVNGTNASIFSLLGAEVNVAPSAVPLRGSSIAYNPRVPSLQQLPAGARRSDSFHYAIVDIGAGRILGYEALSNFTKVISPSHRLTNGEPIEISGTDTGTYDGIYAGATGIERLGDDAFLIRRTFAGDLTMRGSWRTVRTRQPTTVAQAQVSVTLLGVNDPPTPVLDKVATDEETVLRIMGDPDFAGSTNTVFDTDIFYAQPRSVAPLNLLANDSDPDTDDDSTTLQIVGVAGSVTGINSFEGDLGVSPVIVTSTNHALQDGATILISGYAPFPSYNGYHVVTRLSADTFSIPVIFVGHENGQSASWAVLNDANRLSASSEKGANVSLEIRADRRLTCVVYNPRASTLLNATALGQTNVDTFYYAVEDRHSAITFAKVEVNVFGVNDTPVPTADPDSLAHLSPFLSSSNSLADTLAALRPLYGLAPSSGLGNRMDAQVQLSNSIVNSTLFLTNLWTTDEDHLLFIPSTNLTANELEIDTTDILSIVPFSGISREGAAVSLSLDGQTVSYDPTISSNLNSLAREELLIDSFSVEVTDSQGGTVTNLVAVLVVGVNDSPVAQDDAASTFEDVLLSINPISFPSNNPALHDYDVDINGHAPDNTLSLVPVTNVVTSGQALVSIFGNVINFDPSVSAFFNGLAHTQSYVDTFEYTLMDSSFIFANDDLFRVEADGSDFVLDVLANDSNLTGVGGPLTIVSVGTASRGGSVSQVNGSITYSPQVNFVGDEVFTYTVSDESGHTDQALVTVRVTVDQLNGNLQANADQFSVALGEVSVLNVLANDNVLPAAGNALSLTRIVAPPANGSTAIISSNLIIFTPGPSTADDSFSYEISGGGSARATATVQVLVIDRQNTLNVRDDAFSVVAGSAGNVLDVLLNDNILPGSTAGLVITDLMEDLPFHGQITIDSQGKTLEYTPDPGFVGADTLTYLVSDGLGGTGSASVRISVGSLAAGGDFFTVPYDTNGVTINLDVLANDLVLQGTSGTNITIDSLQVISTNTPVGMVDISAGGKSLVYNPANASEGEFEYQYRINDGSGRTALARVTLVVLSSGVKANADYFTVAADSSANELSILANDVAIPDQGNPLTVVSIGTGLNAPNRGGTVVLGEGNGRLVYTPAPGFTGEETFTYTMTDSRRTDVAQVFVRVTAGAVSANTDVFTVFFEFLSDGVTAREFVLPVLANDQVLPNAGEVLTITTVGLDAARATNAPLIDGSIQMNADATSLIYRPLETNGPFPYIERFAYEITDGTTRRASAVAIIEVKKRVDVHHLDTRPDVYSVAAGSQGNILRVLANDDVKPARASGWTITRIDVPPDYNGVVSIAGTNLIYTPQPDFLGTETFSYSVSDGLGGTGTSEVKVHVGALPLSQDIFTVLSGTSSNALDVLANDAVRPGSAAEFALLDAFNPGVSGQEWRFQVSSNRVLYTPDPAYTNAYPYIESFLYRVQDDSLGTVTGRVNVAVYLAGSDRDSALLQVTVNGVNDIPTIDGTGPAGTITDKQTLLLFPNVIVGEVDHQGQQPLIVTVTLDQARGFIANLGGFLNIAPGVYTFAGTATEATLALRGLVYDPIENRIPVPTSETTTFTISANDGVAPVPTTDSATVVTVVATNDPPVITGTVANQSVYRLWTIKPFAGVTVTEVDDLTLQPLQVTVSLDSAAKGYLTSLGGFVSLGGGVYRLGTASAGVTAAEASAALRNLVFVPTTGSRVSPGTPEITQFTISVDDSFAAPVVDTQTSVVALHEYATKIGAGDGSTSDSFGSAVGAGLNYVVVGAPLDDDRGNNSGSAYVYARASQVSTQWLQVQKLVPLDLSSSAEFGGAVAISQDTIVAGARGHRPAGAATGAAYVYQRLNNTWTQAKMLVAPDASSGDEFGSSVGVDGDIAVVGARADDDAGNSSGSAYVFYRNQGGSNNWGFVKKLVASDAAGGDEFGGSVSVSAGTIAIGARLDTHAGVRTGSAYVFGRNQGGSENWGQVKKLFPTDGMSSDDFGTSVGVSGDSVIVGARGHDQLGNDTGTAYLFSRDMGGINNWGLRKKLLPPSVLNNDQFGYAVSVSREKAAVGVPFSGFDNQSKYGSAYAYAANQGGVDNWGVLQMFDRPDPGNNDQYGIAVSVGQDTLAIGVNGDDDRGNESGSVYIYRLKFNNPPVLVIPIAEQVAVSSQPFVFSFPADTFSDSDVGDTLTLSAILQNGSALPAWLTFDPVTRTFSGTPDTGSTYAIALTATDEDGAAASALFTINVDGGSVLVGFPNPPVRLNASTAAAGGLLSLSYYRPIGADSSSYRLEASSDLNAWAPANLEIVSETVTPVDAGLDHVILSIRVPIHGGSGFFRLSIQR